VDRCDVRPAAIMDGDRVLRPGLGTMSHGYEDGSLDIGEPDGPRRVTIDGNRAVYERFPADGPGWEARMADALKRTVEAGAPDGLCAEWLSAGDEEAWGDL